ncbi:SUKH-4 family immunity protein [Bacillus pseudomycoides]|uniref:SUKH-4 family immunity protein n=1 Tax=Bacillus pseudomycoides TaxID=64104 RepID=UPI0023DCD0F3|nr:SUKH-4 family immunity protein [Bacillus pseudomycoides]MDF2084870.1 SUKH-4 family immunity protein [Bacillus pseudomycoides]
MLDEKLVWEERFKLMNPNEFLKRWNQKVYPLVHYEEDKLKNLDIPVACKYFLLKSGFPESAAPFLNFESTKNGSLLTLKEKYNVDASYERNTYLGFTGEGNILSMKVPSGMVVCIDHEKMEEVYVNQSIPQLAECMLEYSEFIKRIKEVNGRHAYLNREYKKEDLEVMIEKFIEIDKDCLNHNTFWNEEINPFHKD